ncbi:bZIP_2 domain-containing protein [Cephalotus follicularis]|uniref:BZIP_2 domain-containing protein n=1 Tax=Cephalotus follicularis TaxID=3775 RepID=A0A1Q3BF55_CEPFO|nr:bZIP_2 domain-containing protein [Cephalotus follicularis]
MESMSKKIDQGIPPWPKKSLDESPFANSNGAGASSSGTETGFQPSDAGIIKLSTVGDGGIKKTQNPSPISDKITRSSIGGHVTSRAGGGNSVNDVQIRSGRNLDHAMDPKKLRRIISNRVSAQKSRMKKLQYVTEMERRVKALQAQIAALAPQVALYKDHQLSLKLEQKRLNERMAALAKNEKLRDGN